MANTHQGNRAPQSSSHTVDEPVALDYTLEELFSRHHSDLLAFLKKRLYNRDDAEDVAQEVYFRLARQPNLDKITYPKAFLIRIATNLLIDMNRCRQNLQADVPLEPEEMAEQYGDDVSGPEVSAEGEEFLTAMQQALSQLSPKCRAIFVMNRVHGVTFRQIAEDLNLSRSMVEKYMRQALLHLQSVRR